MIELPIPAKMDEIDSAWLTAALRAGGVIQNATVTSSPRVTIGQGVGILGELARVTLEYDQPEPGAPASLIAKIPTADPGGRGIAQMLGFYEKEARFYGGLCHSVGVAAAKGYYAAGDPETVRYVILMEDLCALELGDQVRGATDEQCRMLVSEMARLHAKWWQSEELAGLDWIPAVNSDTVKLSAVAYAQALAPFLANFGQHLSDAEREMVAGLGPRMLPILDHVAAPPATLCHGDLRLDNVFWGSAGSDAPLTLVDWQIAVRGRGVYDIGYFMSQSVEPAERAAIETELVRDYHTALTEKGVAGYSLDECWDDYRIATMFCLAYPVIACGSIDLANDRGMELATKMLHRSLSAIRGLKAHEILDRFEPQLHPLLAG